MLRLIITILLFLPALLVLFSAPMYYLWYVAIIVTEFPWVFIIISCLLLFWNIQGVDYRVIGSLISIAALILYSLPIIQAYSISGKLDEELQQAFGASPMSPSDEKPFNALKMITGIGAPQLPYQSHVYDTQHQLSLDFYQAKVAGKRPCVVVIHGGSWRGGDSQQLPELNTVLANEGYHVASINYRKVPQCLSPAPVEDLRQALTWLHEHASSMQIDTNNLVLLGRSAGGQMALMGGYTMQDMGVKGVISYYGPADMIWGYQNPANPLVYNSCQVLEDYMGGSLTQVPQQYAAGSPIEFVNENSVPTLMIYGKNDVLVSYHHSTRLSEKLQQYQVPHYLLTLPWATHGCDYTLNGPSGQLATYSVLRFLSSILKESM